MTESEFDTLADAVFHRLEDALAAYEDSVEYELAPGGVLELEFEDGGKIVINRQRGNHEIWVAAKSGGFHFRHDQGVWRDTRSGEELFVALGRLASLQAGEAIDLAG